MRSAQNLCFVVNRFYALFRLNGSSKPSLTSKPLLTIALKILKTIEKPLVPMVGPPKKHSMVMVQLCQNHWKTIDGNGGLKKNINHSIALKNWPSLWSTCDCNSILQTSPFSRRFLPKIKVILFHFCYFHCVPGLRGAWEAISDPNWPVSLQCPRSLYQSTHFITRQQRNCSIRRNNQEW